MASLTRRHLLALVGTRSDLTETDLIINPRDTWAGTRQPKGPPETEDVRFLIVHHSASWNGHSGEEAPAILRSFYDFHTGPERGWNDIAYNFLIDADGGVWEGRAGSLDGPVAGDATGGNQGHTQLVCVIGDFNEAHPSEAALSSLVTLLAWLADRYEISTSPGAVVTFTSRGSSRHAAGRRVTTPTITGHRTMSQTSCPGDHLDAYVVGSLMADVETLRAPPSTTTTTSTTTMATSTPTTTAPTTTVPPPTTGAPTTAASPATSTIPVAAADPGGGGPTAFVVTVGAAIVVTGAGLALWRHRRMSG